MSQTIGTIGTAPAPNQPVDPTVAHGRAITAATAHQAAAFGLDIRAQGRWPESGHDQRPPALPGFIVSSFSPVAAVAAARCLSRRTTEVPVTAILIATARGDRQSAEHVAHTVAEGGLLGPLLFFQSVPNAVAGHIAARWNLTGPVVCLADAASALEAAAQLIQDGDADEALLLRIEQGSDGSDGPDGPDGSDGSDGPDSRDQAHAVLLTARNPTTPGERP